MLYEILLTIIVVSVLLGTFFSALGFLAFLKKPIFYKIGTVSYKIGIGFYAFGLFFCLLSFCIAGLYEIWH